MQLDVISRFLLTLYIGVFAETNYYTTVRTDQIETTQKGDALPGYAIALFILLIIVILMMIIMLLKKHIIEWIQCKKSNSIPKQVQVTSHRDSPDSTSYNLTWIKPDDGGSPLIKYNIQYCEVEIIPGRTEYELSKYLKPLEFVDNILPSDLSCKLSPLTPGRYYLVEIQAIHTQGQTFKRFIFKTKEVNLTGKQIGQNRKLLDDHSEHIKEYLDEFVKYDTETKPTLNELGVTLCGPGYGTEDNQGQLDSSPDDDIFITCSSINSDELVKYDTDTKPTLIELAVTWCGLVTGTEDNQGQLELSSTCNSPSSVTFSEPGYSGTQPFNNDKQDANPEQDMAPDVRVVIENSESEDKCQEPLLKDHTRM